ITEHFESLGLNTQLFDGKSLQFFDVDLGARLARSDENTLVIKPIGENEEEDDEFITAVVNETMRPMTLGINGSAAGPLVFAGYGITAPELRYDDYAGLQTEGAVVMVLRKEPQSTDANSRFNGTGNTSHAFFQSKINNAMQHGAAAMLLVNDSASVRQSTAQTRRAIAGLEARGRGLLERLETLDPETRSGAIASLEQQMEGVQGQLQQLKNRLETQNAGLLTISTGGPTARGTTIPVMTISRDLADRLIRGANPDQSLASIEAAIDADGMPHSLAVPMAAELQVQITPSRTKTQNVVAELPGKGDLADQTIVIGAHYDHVGMGGPGSLAPGTIAVHNGADDNGSGTVTMMNIAQRLTKQFADQDNHRRIVFIAFAGEEKGLLGSKHYARFPRFPLEDTVLMVNLDMVGRMVQDEVTVYGTGTAEGLSVLVDDVNQSVGLNITKIPSGYGPSDHMSFHQKGVPVLFYFTGLHRDYHRPSDDLEKINFQGMIKVSDTVCEIVQRVGTSKTVMKRTKSTGPAPIGNQPTAYLGVSLSLTDAGVLVSSVGVGTQAEDMGMRVGDILN
ncbi:MAG: M28 family peptidase, partial [Planctomycetota bacterium]